MTLPQMVAQERQWRKRTGVITRSGNERLQYLFLCATLTAVNFQGFLSERVFGTTAESGGESWATRALVEALLGCTLFAVLTSGTLRFPRSVWFLVVYVAWAIVGGLSTARESSLVEAALYSRYTLFAGVCLFIGANCRLSSRSLRKLSILFAVLSLIQIAGALGEIVLLEERMEWRVGFFTVAGGEMATIYPLVMTAGCLTLYFFHKQRLAFMLLPLAFAVLGFGSGKRALFFLLPLFVVIFVLLRFSIGGTPAPRPKTFFAHGLLCCAIAIPLFFIGTEYTQFGSSLGGEKASDRIEAMVEYALAYEMNKTDTFVSGRTAASSKVVDLLVQQRWSDTAFGYGPAHLMSERLWTGSGGLVSHGIAYGLVGWSRDAVAIGLPASSAIVLFLVSVLLQMMHHARSRRRPLSEKAIAYFSVCGAAVILYAYCFYSAYIMVNLIVTGPVLFAAGIVIKMRFMSKQHVARQA